MITNDIMLSINRSVGVINAAKSKSTGRLNPSSLENLNEKTCRWPIGHPDEANFYFCGRNPMEERVYCKLHVLHAYQPKGWKNEEEENKNTKGTTEELPEFLEKKIRSA